ncbi:MAG: hypothetical protein WD751_11910 [Anaerolineales bacterium]
MPQSNVAYDFLESACEAEWMNNGQPLPCPSLDYVSIGGGFVGILEAPSVEGMGQISESALLTHPSMDSAYTGIFGSYPAMTIEAGDKFQATLACLGQVEAAHCNVKFGLAYYEEDGTYVDSSAMGWEWEKRFDQTTLNIFVDLGPIAGQTVRLVLLIRDNGNPLGDYALWLNPVLVRPE